MRWIRCATALLLALTMVMGPMGCAKEGEVQTGVYKGQEQWSFGNEGATDQKMEVELENGDKVMVDRPAQRPDPGSTVKVQQQKDGSWKVVE